MFFNGANVVSLSSFSSRIIRPSASEISLGGIRTTLESMDFSDGSSEGSSDSRPSSRPTSPDAKPLRLPTPPKTLTPVKAATPVKVVTPVRPTMLNQTATPATSAAPKTTAELRRVLLPPGKEEEFHALRPVLWGDGHVFWVCQHHCNTHMYQ